MAGTFATALLPVYRVINTPPDNPWMGPWYFGQGPAYTYYIPPLTRITPHLYADIHPHWFYSWGFPCHPVWQHCFGHPQYNMALFWDPGYGVINPPGTYPVPGALYRWLDWTGSPSAATFGPFGGPLPVFNQFDPWCRSKYTTNQYVMHILPATFTGNTITAKRYSIEHDASGPPWTQALGDRNLQSFLVAVDGDP